MIWFQNGGGWMAIGVVLESLILWGYLIFTRARAATNMEISPWYALTTPLGAGVFGIMMLASAWKVISRTGVTWKGRVYRAK